MAATAAAGGTISAGQALQDFDEQLDKATDEELQKSSDVYRGLRVDKSEADARAEFKTMMMGFKPAINFALGSVATAFGAAGTIANRGVVGGAGKSLPKRIGIGAAEGSLTEMAQEGYADISTQTALMDAGLQKEYKPGQTAEAIAMGGWLGAVSSGAAGALPGGAKATKTDPGVEVVQPATPAADERAALTAANPQPDIAPDLENIPGGFDVNVPEEFRPTPEVEEDVAPQIPDLAQSEPEIDVIPAPVRAASRRLRARPDPTQEVITPEVTTEVLPQEVQDASQRLAEPVADAALRTEPLGTNAQGGRILPSLDPRSREAERLTKEAHAAAQAALPENKVPDDRSHDLKRDVKREEDNEAAKSIFDEFAKDEVGFPRNVAERHAMRERLKRALKRAEEVGIKIPARVGSEATGDYVVWLREVKDMVRTLDRKGAPPADRDEHIRTFLGREIIAKGGDFSVMRKERIAEGELKKRQQQKGADDTTAPAPAAKVVESVQSAEEKVIAREEGDLEVDIASEGRERPTVVVKGGGFTARQDQAGKFKVETKRQAIKAVAKPKLPLKVAEAKARIEAAAKKTDTKPTEAQKEAGNYAKGTARVHGLEITIETPRGAERRGKSPSGQEWSVKMPDHYGYVKRTTGADGDQVDVYVGSKPESEHVFVIDQHKLEGGFDEHKVMLGYDDAVAAMDAYEKGFSDGKGFERIGKITPMSVTDFKEWLKSGDTKSELPGSPNLESAVRADADAVTRNLTRAGLTATVRKLFRPAGEYYITAPNGTRVRALHMDNAGDVLKSLKVVPDGMNSVLFPFIRKKLADVASDVRVVYLDSEGMRQMGEGGSKIALDERIDAFHHLNPRTNTEYIVVNAARLATPDAAAHIIMHEVAHAATVRAIAYDREAQASVRRVMDEAAAGNPFLTQQYGFTNEAEFVAEALSNPEFQQQLADVQISQELASDLKLRTWKVHSAWDAVVAAIRKLFRLPPNYHTALEAILRVSDSLIQRNTEIRGQMDNRAARRRETQKRLEDEFLQNALINIQRTTDELFSRAARQEQKSSPKLLRVRTADQLAQAAENYFAPSMDGQNPVRVWADTNEMIRTHGQRLLESTEPLTKKLYELERKYKGEVWDGFASLVHDETMSNVFADRSLEDNKHLGKDALAGKWSKAQHARLAAEYAKLPEDLKQVRREAMKYFTDTQNEMSLGIIKNRILKALGVPDDGLAQRIHENKVTDADIAAVGGQHTMDLILDAKELGKIKGPYFPLMRRGDYVVRATYKVTPPGNALRQVDGTWEFDSREKAVAWGEAQELRSDIKGVWVDKTTGLTYGEEDGKQVRITSKDVDAEQRFRVSVQDEHVEFFDSKREAEEAAAEYSKSPAFADVKGVVARRFEPNGKNMDVLSTRLERLVGVLENRDGYKGMTPDAQREVAKAMQEVAIQYLGSTRIQSHRLPRRYVKGASHDLVRNTHEYAQSSSGYLAKLKYAPKLEDALREIRKQADGDYGKNTSMGRSVLANEVEQRQSTNDGFDENSTLNRHLGRVLTASFLDKLFSPAYNIINSLQPAMVTAPVLAARYGAGRAVTELGRAYNDVAAWSVAKQGMRETVTRFAAKTGKVNLIDDIKSRLTGGNAKNERAMLDYLAERGSIEPDMGLEIAVLIKSRDGFAGSVDQGLGYLEGIARQMPRAVEAINRSVTALAAYRLEYARNGGYHKGAVEYAQKTVNNTQGHYSNTNASPWFNHPMLKLSLQFKKYGQMMYHLLGQNIGRALQGETREIKIEAMKTLGYIAATHVAMAGALGLPTEPFKYLLMGAKISGLSAVGWDDIEDWIRASAAHHLGKTAGEVATKGLPRLVGIDLSSRVGLDSLITFGEPKSDKKNDVKAYVLDMVAGAPGSLVGDWMAGANAIGTGDVGKAAELLVPLKFASDSIKAYRQATEGKKTDAGRQLAEPYTMGEALVRAAGFTPQREAEEGAKAAAFRRQTGAATTKRTKLVNDWVNAKGADKVKAQRAVQEYNKSVAKELRIEMKDLTSAAKRRANAGTGVTTTKRTKPALERLEQVYNVQ